MMFCQEVCPFGASAGCTCARALLDVSWGEDFMSRRVFWRLELAEASFGGVVRASELKDFL